MRPFISGLSSDDKEIFKDFLQHQGLRILLAHMKGQQFAIKAFLSTNNFLDLKEVLYEQGKHRAYDEVSYFLQSSLKELKNYKGEDEASDG